MEKQTVILGGGTAGWLAALFFRKILNHNITVISSSEIGIVGAGEGSTGLLTDVVKNILHDFGCNEKDFLKETDSTLKFGIKHHNWTGDGTPYFGPIDFSNTFSQPVDILFNHAVKESIEAYLATGNGHIFMQEKSSFFKPQEEYSYTDTGSHAYHFDAHLVGEYFKKICVQDGVKHIDDEVKNVVFDTDGNIQGLLCESGNIIEGDFFVDASGFKRIISEKLGVKWKSYSEDLPVNKAMPFLLKHKDNAPIPNYTLAHAMDAGWMWQIPTQSRMGCGYVYCDKFITDEQALEEVQRVVGQEVEPLKYISFDSGRLEKLWDKNCLFIGLGAAFAEPLEATSIHTTIAQLFAFCKEYYNNRTQEEYNKDMGQMYDDTRDFLVLHYLGGREDTEFWKHIKNKPIPEGVQRTLDLCKTKIPTLDDWPKYFGSMSSPLYNMILYYLGYLKPWIAEEELGEIDSNQVWEDEYRDLTTIISNLYSHNEFLERLNNEGL